MKVKNIINIAIMLLALSACGSKKTEENKAAAEAPEVLTLDSAQQALAGLQTGKALEMEVSDMFKVNGTIDVPPQNMVSVSMPLGGYLKSTKLLPGMHFNKGEIIATMEDASYINLQQDYLVSKGRLDLYKKEFERQEELHASKANSEKVYQQAKEMYESEQIINRSLQEKLKLIGIQPEKLNANSISRSISVYAPISGFVSKVNVNVGKYVNPTDVLFELVNPEDIHLSLQVFEKDMEHVYMGQKVIAFTNNHPDKKYNCEVILVGKDIGKDRSINIHCHFEQYDKTLVPGTYMNAEVQTPARKTWVVPTEAIMINGKESAVFVTDKPGTYRLLNVITGTEYKGYTEISNASELNISKETLVVKGAYTLWMKMHNTAEE